MQIKSFTDEPPVSVALGPGNELINGPFQRMWLLHFKSSFHQKQPEVSDAMHASSQQQTGTLRKCYFGKHGQLI